MSRRDDISASLEYPPHLADNVPDDPQSLAWIYAPKPVCGICLDDGVVTLLGTVRSGQGPTYDRGCAPCRWCRAGYRRAYIWEQMNQHPLTEYGLDEINPPVPSVNYKDPAERLRQKQATADGLAAWRALLDAQAARGAELQTGAMVEDAFAPSVPEPAERPFG